MISPMQTAFGAGVLFLFGHGAINSVLPPEPASASAPVAQISQVSHDHCAPLALGRSE
jgi:hypothetical protein